MLKRTIYHTHTHTYIRHAQKTFKNSMLMNLCQAVTMTFLFNCIIPCWLVSIKHNSCTSRFNFCIFFFFFFGIPKSSTLKNYQFHMIENMQLNQHTIPQNNFQNGMSTFVGMYKEEGVTCNYMVLSN